MLHVAILRKVREGMEAEFEARISRFFKDTEALPGVSGAYLLRPTEGGPEREYGILRTFTGVDAMRTFYESPPFRSWEVEVGPLVEGEAVRRDFHGLEAFFRSGVPPPKWKMAIVTWLGVTPSVALFSWAVPAAAGPLPPVAMLFTVNVFVVAALTWIVMPLLTKVFARWLRPR